MIIGGRIDVHRRTWVGGTYSLERKHNLFGLTTMMHKILHYILGIVFFLLFICLYHVNKVII